MDQPSTPTAQVINDLFSLTLADGLPVQLGDKTIRYKLVKLRETGVGHERAAVRQAERVVMVAGAPKLLVSDADFRMALTAQHIESFHCDGNTIPSAVIDLGMVDKLSTHDMGLIENRVVLISMAAEVRYGNISQADFDLIMGGGKPADAAAPSPQPVGQAADLGARASEAEPGPALLADYAGAAAGGARAVDAG